MLRIGIAGGGDGRGRARSAVQVGDLASRAESAGFAHFWVPDAIGRGRFTLDPLLVLSAAAARTSTIELGTCVLQVPLRNPVELAHRLLGLHSLCAGRFVFGAGAGSTRGDFDGLGLDFERRFEALDVALPVMQALWGGKTVDGIALGVPDELRGGPPILIGSWGGRWIRRAATEFDGWIASGWHSTWADVEAAAGRYEAAGGGRSVLSSVFADLGDEDRDSSEPSDAITLNCTVAEARRRLRRIEDMGFTDVVVFNRGGDTSLEHIFELVS
jgi:alkanesulfonate monooxygenase SsuD/methylene tetrahydromethanopterin reductase-like flavin-dependent oxidoreductase (luciferase family)